MKRIVLLLSCVSLLLLSAQTSQAQNADYYDQGSLWTLTTIRIDANRNEDYLKRLKKTWGRSMDMAMSEGLIKSYKVLLGNASNEDDYNLLLMVEFENYAQLDDNPEREAKWDKIQEKTIEAMGQDEFDETVADYADMREMLGTKHMREIMVK